MEIVAVDEAHRGFQDISPSLQSLDGASTGLLATVRVQLDVCISKS